MKRAVLAGRIAANPCDGRRLPKTERPGIVFLTPDEWEFFADQIKLPYVQALATWLVTSGMRFSEATALAPSAVNLHDQTARVVRSWKYTGTSETLIDAPKTARSRRTIDLTDAGMEVLDGRMGGDFVHTNTIKGFVRAATFGNLWVKARRKAIAGGLQKSPRVHDLRHTCASWMIAAGVPLPVIQAHLGHESITTTIDRYGHLDRSEGKKAALAISQMMGSTGLPLASLQ